MVIGYERSGNLGPFVPPSTSIVTNRVEKRRWRGGVWNKVKSRSKIVIATRIRTWVHSWGCFWEGANEEFLIRRGYGDRHVTLNFKM